MAENPQSAAMSDPGLFEKWKGWLGAPQNRAALLQTGLSLLQPTYQGTIPHIASSIGQGLGAAGRAESRIAGEQRDAEKLQRELESESLDREVKRTGLELDKLNTESLVGQRNAEVGFDRARLGIDRAKLGNDTRYTEAQIADLQSQGDTREGNLALRQSVEAARRAAVAEKQKLEQEKLGLAQEIAAARQSGDAKRIAQAEARIKQTDTKLAQSAKKVQEAESRAANITLQAMFKTKDKIASDVWTAATDPYAPEPRSQEELLAKRIKLQQDIDAGLGGGERGQSGPAQVPPPQAQSSAEAPRIKRNPKTGQQVILRNGQWVPYP